MLVRLNRFLALFIIKERRRGVEIWHGGNPVGRPSRCLYKGCIICLLREIRAPAPSAYDGYTATFNFSPFIGQDAANCISSLKQVYIYRSPTRFRPATFAVVSIEYSQPTHPLELKLKSPRAAIYFFEIHAPAHCGISAEYQNQNLSQNTVNLELNQLLLGVHLQSKDKAGYLKVTST